MKQYEKPFIIEFMSDDVILTSASSFDLGGEYFDDFDYWGNN